jgi:hypothetical protein
LRILLLCLALAPAAALAGARVSAEDLAQIRTVIEQQTLVRSAECPVYRPAAVRFRDLVLIGPEVVQQVQVTDRGGAVWLAYYAMQRLGDGRWTTSGCRLVQPARSISA